MASLNCGVCGRELNQPGMPETADCGGDCVECMAGCDDPECMELMRRLGDPAVRDEEVQRYEA